MNRGQREQRVGSNSLTEEVGGAQTVLKRQRLVFEAGLKHVAEPAVGGRLVGAGVVPVLKGAGDRVDVRVTNRACPVVQGRVQAGDRRRVQRPVGNPQDVGGQEVLEHHPRAVAVSVGGGGRKPVQPHRVAEHAGVLVAGDADRFELPDVFGVGELDDIVNAIAFRTEGIDHHVVSRDEFRPRFIIAGDIRQQLEHLL